MPFTVSDFFGVLAAYNAALWPAAVVLWVASLGLVLALSQSDAPPQRALAVLLAVHWAWSAIAYHAAFFTRINPAAWIFALLFLLEAAALLWTGVVTGALRFSTQRSSRHLVATLLVTYALAYPVITFAEGMTFPYAPTFGLPCPTTIFTSGLLLMAERPQWTLAAIPVMWAAVGGSAAFLFGVYADLMLPVAGVLLVADWVRRPARA